MYIYYVNLMMLYFKNLLLQLRSIHHADFFQCIYFHNSCVYLKTKKEMKFFNPYIKQYKRKIYKGYIEDHLMQTHKEYMFDIDGDEPDFEQSLLNEAQRRRNIYHHKKKEKRMSDKKTKMPMITAEQIHHIKSLNKENPDIWKPSFLAMSFNFTVDEICLILKSRDQESSNLEASNFVQNLPTLSQEAIPASKLLNTGLFLPEQSNTSLDVLEVENNRWFSSFNNETNTYSELIEVESLELMEDIAEESLLDEHYELFDCDEGDDIDDGHNGLLESDDTCDDLENDNCEADLLEDSNVLLNDDETLNVYSSDNKTFYDSNGRFLYRIP